MIYRIWRIKNRITGRYLALCRADGSLDYIAFLTKQRAQVYMADKRLNSFAFAAECCYTSPEQSCGTLCDV